MLAGSWVVAAIGFALLNVLLLGTVGFVWLSNYRTFRTPLLFGLVGFAAVMLVENLVVIYSFVEWGRLYADSTFAKHRAARCPVSRSGVAELCHVAVTTDSGCSPLGDGSWQQPRLPSGGPPPRYVSTVSRYESLCSRFPTGHPDSVAKH